MSVLLNMGMPASCFECPFMYGRRYCRANSKIEFNDPDYSELKGRYDGCPLVPADDVRPVVSGKWIPYSTKDCLYYCSNCNALPTTKTKYCPNCGADMREGET